jgi:hypothetical protein
MKRKERVPQHTETPQRRVRDIRLPGTSKTNAGQQHASSRSSFSVRSIDRYDRQHSLGRRILRSAIWMALVVALVLVVGAFVLQRAHVEIIPHTIEGPLDVSMVLGQTPRAGVDLVYETMRITRETTQRIEVEAFDTEEQVAFGTITIYNEESQAQRFIEETRFESPEGLIFQLPKGDGITVPGATNGQPGSIDVVVYAEQSGAEYTLDPTDFVIPGWRETGNPKFETQYARSSERMADGGDGRVPRVDADEQSRITADLQKTLKDQIIAQAWVQVPEQFIFFEDASQLTFSEPTFKLVNIGGVYYSDVTITGTFETLLFQADTIGAHLAATIEPRYNNEPIRITNVSNLAAMISPEDQVLLGWSDSVSTPQDQDTAGGEEGATNTDSQGNRNPRMRITGDVRLRMKTDADDVAAKIAQQPLGELSAIFQSLSTVARANRHIRPFWRYRMPRTERITVVIDEI